jgi:beta-lactamase class A
MRSVWNGLAIAVAAHTLIASPAIAAPSGIEVPIVSLQAEVTRLAQQANGVVGVAAWRLDGTGPKLLLNPEDTFPLASTFKVAVASRILQRIDKGEMKLDQMLDVKPDDMVPSEVLADRFIHPGVSLSVYNLLELMLTQSDNSATDVLTAAAGGPTAVTAWLREQGIAGQRIDRDTNGLLRDFYGLPAGPSMTVFGAVPEKDKASIGAKGSMPNPAFDDDPRDQSTPTAMADLLTRIFNGKALSPESTRVIIGIMERCRTSPGRLKGILPRGTLVAHKTGTIGGTANDVGVMTLPGKAGQIVIAVYVKKSMAPTTDRDRTIAEIARAAYDYFLVTSPAR